MKNKKVKKIFHSPWFIGITATIIGSVLSAELFSKFKILTTIFNLPMKIYHIKIPDFIILIFVLIIVIWLILINKYIQGPSPKKFKRDGWQRLIVLETMLVELEKELKEKEKEIKNIHILMGKIEQRIWDMEKISS